MENIDDGGQAFPMPCGQFDFPGDGEYNYAHSGMSLRDWFAGMAMQGDWAAQGNETGVFNMYDAPEFLEKQARHYYRMADAMLKARDSNQGE